MERDKIAKIIGTKILSKDWHWLSYHFAPYKNYEHFLVTSIINCCCNIEKVIPSYAEEFSDRLASLSNREKFLPHYEQIIQLLAELYVINHFSGIYFKDAVFTFEPTAIGSKKNPELGIKTQGKEIYIEVKCSEYIKHHNNRARSTLEIPSRMDGIREIVQKITTNSIVYPKDNVIKDFLCSANEKFESFKTESPNSITILVIIWSDFIYEPISSLLNKATGLLTENSFYRKDDKPVKFENIDSILLVRHSHHIVRATRDNQPVDGLSHPLEWGNKNCVLPKAYIPIKPSLEIDNYLCDILQAHHINELSHFADYRPQEIIFHI